MQSHLRGPRSDTSNSGFHPLSLCTQIDPGSLNLFTTPFSINVERPKLFLQFCIEKYFLQTYWWFPDASFNLSLTNLLIVESSRAALFVYSMNFCVLLSLFQFLLSGLRHWFKILTVKTMKIFHQFLHIWNMDSSKKNNDNCISKTFQLFWKWGL